MDMFGGLLLIIGIIVFFTGQPVGIIISIVGYFLYQYTQEKEKEKEEQRKKEQQLRQEKNSANNISSSVSKTSNNINKDMEVYVIVRFDNYPKLYTYLAPTNRYLRTGERVLIRNKKGELKYVTVVKGNHKCPRKTDMFYSRINIV